MVGVYLTGRDPLSRLIEWLYTITGQRPALPPVEKLALPKGFAGRWEEVPGDGWVAMVFVGKKQD